MVLKILTISIMVFVFLIKNFLLHIAIIYLYKPLTPYYIIIFMLLVLKNIITINYYRFKHYDKNLFMVSSPIKKYEFSMTSLIYEIFIICPQQNAFLVSYVMYSKLYRNDKIIKIILYYVKSIAIAITISTFGLVYVQYNLIKILINILRDRPMIDIQEYYCIVVRENLLKDKFSKSMCIRVFDGFVKVNGEIKEKSAVLAQKVFKICAEATPRQIFSSLSDGRSVNHINLLFSKDSSLGMTWTHGILWGKIPLMSGCAYGGVHNGKVTKAFLTIDTNAHIKNMYLLPKMGNRVIRDYLRSVDQIVDEKYLNPENIHQNECNSITEKIKVDLRQEIEKFKNTPQYEMLCEISKERALTNCEVLNILKLDKDFNKGGEYVNYFLDEMKNQQ